MKKCSDCNIEMLEHAEITGQHPHELGVDGRSDILVSYIAGKKEVKNFFGKVKEKENYCEHELKARICPKYGKVELYIDINSTI